MLIPQGILKSADITSTPPSLPPSLPLSLPPSFLTCGRQHELLTRRNSEGEDSKRHMLVPQGVVEGNRSFLKGGAIDVGEEGHVPGGDDEEGEGKGWREGGVGG